MVCICEFSQLQIKNTWKQISESSKKQNLNLLPIGHYLHSIYNVFTAIYIKFALY